MESKITDYLISELGRDAEVAAHLTEKVSRYADIRDAFLGWLDTRTYGDAPVIHGYTPAKISRLNPQFNGIGVYNFMVTLRENPEAAERYIAEGFQVA